MKKLSRLVGTMFKAVVILLGFMVLVDFGWMMVK